MTVKEFEAELDLTEDKLLTVAELRLCEMDDNELHLLATEDVAKAA